MRLRALGAAPTRAGHPGSPQIYERAESGGSPRGRVSGRGRQAASDGSAASSASTSALVEECPKRDAQRAPRLLRRQPHREQHRREPRHAGQAGGTGAHRHARRLEEEQQGLPVGARDGDVEVAGQPTGARRRAADDRARQRGEQPVERSVAERGDPQRLRREVGHRLLRGDREGDRERGRGVPERRPRSWPPPCSSGFRAAVRLASSAPTPAGPPTLTDETLIRSAPEASNRVGTAPNAAIASTWTGTADA